MTIMKYKLDSNFKSTMNAKLVEMESDFAGSDMLFEFVSVMLNNQKGKDQIYEELLDCNSSDESRTFVEWLFEYLSSQDQQQVNPSNEPKPSSVSQKRKVSDVEGTITEPTTEQSQSSTDSSKFSIKPIVWDLKSSSSKPQEKKELTTASLRQSKNETLLPASKKFRAQSGDRLVVTSTGNGNISRTILGQTGFAASSLSDRLGENKKSGFSIKGRSQTGYQQQDQPESHVQQSFQEHGYDVNHLGERISVQQNFDSTSSQNQDTSTDTNESQQPHSFQTTYQSLNPGAPACRHGLMCRYPNCRFSHPDPMTVMAMGAFPPYMSSFGIPAYGMNPMQPRPPSSGIAASSNAAIPVQCKYFPNCLNPMCSFYHPEKTVDTPTEDKQSNTEEGKNTNTEATTQDQTTPTEPSSTPAPSKVTIAAPAPTATVSFFGKTTSTIPCRYDPYCMRPGCIFYHPSKTANGSGTVSRNKSLVLNKPGNANTGKHISERGFAVDDSETERVYVVSSAPTSPMDEKVVPSAVGVASNIN